MRQGPEPVVVEKSAALLRRDRGFAVDRSRADAHEERPAVRRPAHPARVDRELRRRPRARAVRARHPDAGESAVAAQIGEPSTVRGPGRSHRLRVPDWKIGNPAQVIEIEDELPTDVDEPGRSASVERNDRDAEAIAVARRISAPQHEGGQPAVGRHAERRLAVERDILPSEIAKPRQVERRDVAGTSRGGRRGEEIRAAALLRQRRGGGQGCCEAHQRRAPGHHVLVSSSETTRPSGLAFSGS